MAKISKLINTQKTKYFWLYIVVGAILMIVSIMLMPFWKDIAPDLFFASYGEDFIKIVVAGVLVLYMFGYLLKKLIKTSIMAVKVLSIVEFTVLSLIALGCIISQFAVFYLDISIILALAVWMRGLVEVVRAYLYNNASEKYPVSKLVIAIVLITLGGYVFASNVITAEIVLWVATIFAFIIALIIFVLGFYKNPNTKKTKKK
ncbi:MAG: hypothetical protein IKA54_01395 [Clostridia bacterium]|nr:hypothetical protein [Clostridia bacterium]